MADAMACEWRGVNDQNCPAGPIRPRSAAHLSAVWGRNRALCVNMLIHGHLCVCGFGRCRRDAHRSTFICQESVRNRGLGLSEITGMVAPNCRANRTSGRDGPYQFDGVSLMCIHRSRICHIGGADQDHFPIRPEIPARPHYCERRRPGQRPLTEDGCPARLGRRAASLPASHPHRQPAPPASRQLLNTESNRKGRDGGVACPICRASRRGSHRRMRAHQGRVNAGMVGDDVKERPDNFSET
jgi:hypothetical protein